jgi:hypothetical protein
MAGKGAGMRTASLVLAGITCMALGLTARPALADATLPLGEHIAATIPGPAGPAGVEAGFGSIWVANGPAGAIVRIDPASNQVVATIQAGRPACCLALRGQWPSGRSASPPMRWSASTRRPIPWLTRSRAEGLGPKG